MANFPKSARLLKSDDFQQVFNAPQKRSSDRYFTVLGHFYLLADEAEGERMRLGIAIAKKRVRKAHDRNRLKRLVRESFRHIAQNKSGVDLVVLAKSEAIEADNRKLFSSLARHWQRILS